MEKHVNWFHSKVIFLVIENILISIIQLLLYYDHSFVCSFVRSFIYSSLRSFVGGLFVLSQSIRSCKNSFFLSMSTFVLSRFTAKTNGFRSDSQQTLQTLSLETKLTSTIPDKSQMSPTPVLGSNYSPDIFNLKQKSTVISLLMQNFWRKNYQDEQTINQYVKSKRANFSTST